MSGSTDAATVAERTKLQAQLMEAQEGLDDTYYSHAKDAQSQALDDENEAYTNAQEKYLEMLRETLEDTATIINQKISEFLLNADVGLETLNGISQEHGITLSDSLMQPWENASLMAESFKQIADENVFSLINEDGVVTIFKNTATDAFNSVFAAGGSAATLFTGTVNEKINQIKTIVQQSTSPLTANLKFPWNNTLSPDGPINTFSREAKNAISGAVQKAKDNAEAMKNWLKSPWDGAKNAVNTFSNAVKTALSNASSQAESTAAAINKVATAVKNVPSYIGTSTSGSGNGSVSDTGTKDTPTTPKKTTTYYVVATLKANGVNYQGFGTSAVSYAKAQENAYNNVFTIGINALSKHFSPDQLQSKWDKIWSKNISYTYSTTGFDKRINPSGVTNKINGGLSSKNTIAQYAKGTLGTKEDQWALTDEIGDELVLIPGKDGNLQYMRKGTAVIPAEISSNLMEWGKLNPNMDGMANAVQGVNLMTNVVNKPELNLSFEALVKAESITNETLPAVKKLVTEELDKFSKNLNYSLKRIGAK